MRTLFRLFVFTFLILAVSVRDELGARVAEVDLRGQVGFAVGVYHEASWVTFGAVGKSKETVTKFMQNDFPEL